jgi:hypothetical protein
MVKRLITTIVLLAGISNAQEGLTVQGSGKKSVADDAQKVYASACAVIRRQVGATHQPNPRILLVLGADKDEALWHTREIRLKKWDPFLFAQGAVLFALDEVMIGRKIEMAREAVAWSQATIDVKQRR